MRWLAVAGALTLAPACSSSSDPPPMMMGVDAPVAIDAACVATPCGVLAQTGCTAGQRCTWIVDDHALGGGRIGCAPTGASAQGLPCTRDAGGSDLCVRGTTCDGTTCRAICDLHGGAPMCDQTLTCKPAAMFQPCGIAAPIAGLCLP